MSRKAGILLPIFSLPSEYGIGTLGRAAYRWVDFLNDAHQKLWQVLPVGPTSYGDSPYQSFSAFAGNPYFIDLELLCDQKLLTKDESLKCRRNCGKALAVLSARRMTPVWWPFWTSALASVANIIVPRWQPCPSVQAQEKLKMCNDSSGSISARITFWERGTSDEL